MAANVANTLAGWSVSEGSNLPTGSTPISNTLDDDLRMIQAKVRTLCAASTIASAATCDIGAVEEAFQTVSGVTTITSFGTVSAGIYKYLTASGVFTVTHNATSLICLGGASITTAVGDIFMMLSLGGGNWRMMSYSRASGQPLIAITSFPDGLVGTPGLYLASDPNNGLYKTGTDSVSWSAGGALHMTWALATGVTVPVNTSIGNTSKINIAGANVTMLLNTAGNFIINPAGGGGGIQYSGTSSTGAGVSFVAGSGGDAIYNGGANTGANAAGNVRMTAGDTATGAPGNIFLTTGAATSSGVGGAMSIVLNGLTTPGYLVIGTATASFYKINGAGKHIAVIDSGNRPTIASGGGTSPAITGSDNAFKVTVGSGGIATSVTVNFNTAWNATPVVIAQHQGTVLPLAVSASTTSVQISASSAFTAGAVIDVICIGIE